LFCQPDATLFSTKVKEKNYKNETKFETSALQSESHELLEDVENVGIQVLGKEKRLQGGAILLHLLVVLK
jgi:hypothetical protein